MIAWWRDYKSQFPCSFLVKSTPVSKTFVKGLLPKHQATYWDVDIQMLGVLCASNSPCGCGGCRSTRFHDLCDPRWPLVDLQPPQPPELFGAHYTTDDASFRKWSQMLTSFVITWMLNGYEIYRVRDFHTLPGIRPNGVCKSQAQAQDSTMVLGYTLKSLVTVFLPYWQDLWKGLST